MGAVIVLGCLAIAEWVSKPSACVIFVVVGVLFGVDRSYPEMSHLAGGMIYIRVVPS